MIHGRRRVRQRFLRDSDINKMCRDLDIYIGQNGGDDEITVTIFQKKKQRILDAGLIPLSITSYKPFYTTLHNYK